MATEYLDKAGLKRLLTLLKAEIDKTATELRNEFALSGGGGGDGGTGGNGLTLGETAYSAYPGDKGKANAEAIEELQDTKQDKLKAGANITISQDGTISATGGGGGGIMQESDPTVYDWAKQPTKPTYTYSEIGGKPTLGALAGKDSISYDEIEGAPTALQLGETSTKAYPGNKGKANADAIAELQELLELKQDALSFDGTYNANTNKVATVKTVLDKIAEVVASAPDDLNTLEEIAAWIAKHPESVTAINAAIQANTDKIAENTAAIEANAGVIEQNTQSIGKTLTEAKAYTDEKVGDIESSITQLQTDKQDKLTAGENITIENGVISASGGGTESPKLYVHEIVFNKGDDAWCFSFISMSCNTVFNSFAEVLSWLNRNGFKFNYAYYPVSGSAGSNGIVYGAYVSNGITFYCNNNETNTTVAVTANDITGFKDRVYTI